MVRDYAKTSFEKTASATINSGPCRLCAVLMITDGTNPATAILYNLTSAVGAAAGNKVWEGTVAGATGYGGRNWTVPVACDTGLYLALSGTGASAIVEYI